MSISCSGALSLSPIQAVLVFAGIPLAVVVLVAGLVYASGARRAKRYRPNRPSDSFEFTPVWLLASPTEQGPADGHGGAQAEGGAAGHGATALTAGASSSTADTAKAGHGDTGGASDRW